MSDKADWISAISTSGATLVSVIATVIAAKAADASRSSAEIAEKVLHRSALRDLITESNALIGEVLFIESLSIDLKSEYSYLATRAGAIGSSRNQVHATAIDKDVSKAKELSREAHIIIADQAKLISASGYDIDLMKGRIESGKIELISIRESMHRQLESIRLQNQKYRDK